MLSVVRGLAIVQVFALRLGLRVRLSRRSLDGLLRELSGERPWRRSGTLSPNDLGEVMERAERVLQRVPGIGSSCLYRSLGRFGVLSAWGYLPTFFMGVSAANPEQGHAWVELGGVAFREAQLGDYVVSFRFPPAPVERC